jgi:hypothetical protein
MYWYGFVTGAVVAYAGPLFVVFVMLCRAAFIDWRYRGSRSLDPYSRSIEDDDESEWHTRRYGR